MQFCSIREWPPPVTSAVRIEGRGAESRDRTCTRIWTEESELFGTVQCQSEVGKHGKAGSLIILHYYISINLLHVNSAWDMTLLGIYNQRIEQESAKDIIETWSNKSQDSLIDEYRYSWIMILPKIPEVVRPQRWKSQQERPTRTVVLSCFPLYDADTLQEIKPVGFKDHSWLA